MLVKMRQRMRSLDVFSHLHRDFQYRIISTLDRQARYKGYIGEVAGLAVNRGLHIPGHFARVFALFAFEDEHYV